MAWSTGEYLRMDIEAQNEWGNETIVDRRVLEPWFCMRVCDWVFKRGVGGPGSRVRVCVECGELILQTSESVGNVEGVWKECAKLKNNLYEVDKEKN